MSKSKAAATVVALATAVLAAPAQAHAGQASSTASASLGEADIVVAGTQVSAEPIAPCDVSAGPAENGSRYTAIGTKTEFGSGATACTRAGDGTSHATATGYHFSTDVLRQFGGPQLSVRSYTAQCATTENGSSGSMEISGAYGFDVPESIPANHTITIPGENAGDPPMAKLVLNELVAPTPPDGSLTTHALRITLFPEGGPASGEIVVGTANCDPFGGQAPSGSA